MKNQSLSIHAFENTEIAFSSRSDMELKQMYLLFSMMNNNVLVDVGTTFLKFAFKIGLPVSFLVKPTIFSHFCGGENIKDCERTIQKLANFNIGTILDYSVEGEKNEESYEATKEETIKTILRAKGQKQIPFSVFKITGVGSTEVLTKVQEKATLSSKEQMAWQAIQRRVDEICQAAYQHQVRIFIDAEETWIQETIDDLAYSMMEKYNKEKAIVYNTFQMYTVSCLGRLKQAYAEAQKKGYFLGVKQVRGAYMEKERLRAQKMGYPDPIQPNKETCDKDFDAGLEFCIQNYPNIALCAGTHNEKSSYYLASMMQQVGISPHDETIYFAQLYGMSDHISYNLAKLGYNVAKYVPYGPVKDVMPYLFRRASENTSVAGQSSREFNLIKREVERRRG